MSTDEIEPPKPTSSPPEEARLRGCLMPMRGDIPILFRRPSWLWWRFRLRKLDRPIRPGYCRRCGLPLDKHP